MKNFLKNVFLLIFVLVLSYYTASYFGAIYNLLTPSQVGTTWIGTERSWQFAIGLPLGYIFILTFVFQIFGFGNRNKWMWWLLVPVMIFFAIGGVKYIYVPFAVWLIAFGLTILVRKISRLNHT